MLRKILILSNNVEWRKNLAKELRTNNKTLVTIAQNRSDAISVLSQEDQHALVIDDSYSVKDVEILLKYMSSNRSQIHLFFVSKNFDEFKEILKVVKGFKSNLIDAPIATSNLNEIIIRTLFTIDPTSEVDRQTRMNLQFLKIFTEATKKILQDFCGLADIQHGKPKLLKKDEVIPYSVRGSIELKSDFFEGTYFIHLDQTTYLKIVNRLLLTNDKEITDENKDFAGEIVNMIYGQAKIDLNLGGYNFDKAFPKYEILPDSLNTNHSIVQLELSTNEGKIEMLIEIKKMQGFVI